LLTDTENITGVSRRFLQLYHYSEQELIGKPIANLLPKSMRSLHQQKLQEWEGSEILTPCLKLLQTASGHIETFYFTLQIFPDLDKGLQYVGFLQPQENAKHFLYNVKDDCFIALSEKLAATLKPLGYDMSGP